MNTGIKSTTFLNDTELNVAAYVEQFYWTNKQQAPSTEYIAKALGMEHRKVASILAKEAVQTLLEKRGVLSISKQVKGTLTHQQIFLANSLLNVEDHASLREKLKAANIKISQYHGWLADPAFQQYMRSKAEVLFNTKDIEVLQALTDAAVNGDVSAIKLYLEVTGRYNPRIQIDVNVEAILGQVVEILARHLAHDPDKLSAIADDLEIVTSRMKAIPTRAIEIG